MQGSPAHYTRALMRRLLGEADLARRLGLGLYRGLRHLNSTPRGGSRLPLLGRPGDSARPSEFQRRAIPRESAAGPGQGAPRSGRRGALGRDTWRGRRVSVADELHLTVACVLIEGLIYAASAWLITSGLMIWALRPLFTTAALLRISILPLAPYLFHSEYLADTSGTAACTRPSQTYL